MFVKSLMRTCDGINEWTGRIVAWSIWVVMGLCVFEVITRRIFNAPHIWSYDVINVFYALHFMLLAGYTLLHQRHVAVDIVSITLPPKTQNVLRILTYLVFFFPFAAVLLYIGAKSSISSWTFKERTAIGLPLIYPIIKTITPVTALLLIIQGVSEFTKCLVSSGNEETSHD